MQSPEIPERLNCGPMKLGRCYVADVIDMNPIEEIKPYHGPVLIVHGTKDGIVKLEYSRQAQRAYHNAKLHIIEGGAHGFGKKHDAIAIAHLRVSLDVERLEAPGLWEQMYFGLDEDV